MLVMILGLDLGLVVAGGISRKQLLLHLASVILLAASVVLTNSRGGIFAMLVSVILLASLFVMRRLHGKAKEEPRRSTLQRLGRLALSIVLICGIAIAMSFAVARLGGEPLERRIGEFSAETDNDNNGSGGTQARHDVWQASWRLIKANPIVGVGFGAFRTSIPLYHVASGSDVPETAINGYLDFLSSGGLVGCAILAWFIVAFFRNLLTVRRSKSSFEYAARLGGLAGLFGLAVHSLVDNGLNVPINGILLTALIVICTAEWKVTRRNLTDTQRGGALSDGPKVLLRAGTMSRKGYAE